MQAKQCDRCGAFYSGERYNPQYRLTQISQTKSRYSKSLDLCPKCSNSLAEWFEAHLAQPEDIEREKKQ